MIIKSSSGVSLQIDAADHHRLVKKSIYPKLSGFYIENRPLGAWLLGTPKSVRVYHVNGDDRDFRKENLVTRRQDASEHEFMARIKVDGLMRPVGPFRTIAELQEVVWELLPDDRRTPLPPAVIPDAAVVSIDDMKHLNPGLSTAQCGAALLRKGFLRHGLIGTGATRTTVWTKPEVKDVLSAWESNFDRVHQFIASSTNPLVQPDILSVQALSEMVRMSTRLLGRILSAAGWECHGSPAVAGDRQRIWTKDWDRSLLGDPAEALRQRVKDFENKTH